MAYATTPDMIEEFGEEELIHLTARPGELHGPVVTSRVERALSACTDLINSYLRRRYQVPLSLPAPASITHACCVLARFDLSNGEQKTPTEQMRLQRKEVITWLEGLAVGTVQLDGVPLAGGSGAGAQASDRPRHFSEDSFRGW
ncbi:gp436 family protein [Plastoroseomonas hellenica]|uniref:gp436 family protein n=1 Tax=Plastoroseomonas hellenica TaxID=2687306 RepID=UPI001BA49848|nr:DUF1320 domain-containing protein [Plastoroseomonas hellenica]MBR0643991.1 DUF1320 domain-containing protein [Plastoroseomonas hellenica]